MTDKWFRKMAKCPYCGRRQAMDFHIDLPNNGFHECKYCHGWFTFGFEDGILLIREMTEQEFNGYYAIIQAVANSNPDLFKIVHRG